MSTSRAGTDPCGHGGQEQAALALAWGRAEQHGLGMGMHWGRLGGRSLSLGAGVWQEHGASRGWSGKGGSSHGPE